MKNTKNIPFLYSFDPLDKNEHPAPNIDLSFLPATPKVIYPKKGHYHVYCVTKYFDILSIFHILQTRGFEFSVLPMLHTFTR